MKILKIEPCRGHGGGGAMRIATFSIEINGVLRLHSLSLMRTDGGYRTYFPSVNGGGRSATVAADFAEQITAAALAAYEGHEIANENTASTKAAAA